MDIEQIKQILPHRYPFLLVDRVIEKSPSSTTIGSTSDGATSGGATSDGTISGESASGGATSGRASRVGQWARCVKNVTINEPFFVGHFPKKAVLPGVLIIEAMAQSGALAMYRPGDKPVDVLLASVKETRFRRPVVPGDQLILRAEIAKHRRQSVLLKAEARVQNELVAETSLLVHIVEA